MIKANTALSQRVMSAPDCRDLAVQQRKEEHTLTALELKRRNIAQGIQIRTAAARAALPGAKIHNYP